MAKRSTKPRQQGGHQVAPLPRSGQAYGLPGMPLDPQQGTAQLVAEVRAARAWSGWAKPLPAQLGGGGQ